MFSFIEDSFITYEVELHPMGRKFARDLRARRRKFTTKARDLRDGAASLQTARAKAPEMGLPIGLEDDVIARSVKFRAKAEALDSDIRLEEVSVFVYVKKKGDKSYQYWKAGWRSHNGKMKQTHLGPADGKNSLSEDEALERAQKLKAKDLGIDIIVIRDWFDRPVSWP